MRRTLLAVVCAAALAGLLTGAFAWRSAAALGKYKNVNVAMGSISTADAERQCPQAGHLRLVCLAQALKAAVSPELRSQLQLPYSVADAKKWSNFPPVGYRDRVGPTLGDFSPAQLGLIKAMLREAAGIAANEGYDELEQILSADDFLKQNIPDDAGFSSSNFHFAFLGEPANSGTWELYFGGHHIAFGNTYSDGKLVAATPSFRGIEPFPSFELGGRSFSPMAQERAAFAAMLGALSQSELRQAKLNEIFTDIVAGPQRDDNFPDRKEGVRVGNLKPAQQALVLAAIAAYVEDMAPRDAEAILRRYHAEIADTVVAYSGSPTLDAVRDYVRIDGPSVWIEFSLQPGRSLPGIHPHSVWRDRAGDYAGNK